MTRPQMTPSTSIELRFQEGRSDKVYRAAIEPAGEGYVVTFAYGRRGTTLNTGSKTAQPVDYPTAQSIFDKLVLSKTAKGYKPLEAAGGSGTGMRTVTDREQRDTGLRAQLLNPIEENEADAYLDANRWCAQEKFDGRRMLLQRKPDSDELVAANRDGLSVGYPRALAERLEAVRGPFVLDGECVGEHFHAFDLLEDGARDRRRLPYALRLRLLGESFGGLGGCFHVVETALTRIAKRELVRRLKTGDKEGVVFKDLNAAWSPGRPASGGTALKLKFWASCSCVVLRRNAKRSVELALSGQSVGNVTIPPNVEMPAPGQVVEVRYLYVTAPGGSLYQPVCLGVRDDVPVDDCTIERQRIKYKAQAA